MSTPYEIRLASRNNTHPRFPSLDTPGFLCVNLVMMDAQYASDFEKFCRLNPAACPLLGVIPAGQTAAPDFGQDIDLTTDLRQYDIIEHGKITATVTDVKKLYTKNTVSFLIGSSVSFDGLLIEKGFPASYGQCIYITGVDCKPVGRFQGKMAVTMRSYIPEIAPKVAEFTSHFPKCHGGPVSFNEPAKLGITDELHPFLPFHGPWVPDGHTKLYWPCGITPSIVARDAKLPLMIVHTPGNALPTDLPTMSLYE